ncbi:hypothetical protein PMAYCL1PPCAC_13142, partial [Pristionchus mayeri]
LKMFKFAVLLALLAIVFASDSKYVTLDEDTERAELLSALQPLRGNGTSNGCINAASSGFTNVTSKGIANITSNGHNNVTSPETSPSESKEPKSSSVVSF